MSFQSKKGMPALIPGHFKVKSASPVEHENLLRALSTFGCGEYRGPTQLAPVGRKAAQYAFGIMVSAKGVVEPVSSQAKFDALGQHRELPSQVVLLAPSRKEFVTLVWGSTAWNLLEAANAHRDLVARTARTQNL